MTKCDMGRGVKKCHFVSDVLLNNPLQTNSKLGIVKAMVLSIFIVPCITFGSVVLEDHNFQ